MATSPELLVDEAGKPTPAGWRTIGERLRHPMPTHTRPGRGGRAFEYVTASQVAQRLDETVGPGNWASRLQLLGSEPWIVLCELTLFGVTKADVGYSNAPDSEEESEPAKAAASDALKRAALLWGVGRWLRLK